VSGERTFSVMAKFDTAVGHNLPVCA